jgi:hypothetical protein
MEQYIYMVVDDNKWMYLSIHYAALTSSSNNFQAVLACHSIKILCLLSFSNASLQLG